MESFGRVLVFLGVLLVVLGLIFSIGVKIPWLGQLPGDIYLKKEHFTFYFPLTTSLLLSLILTLVLYLFRR
ncbi:MAG: DUF2905 domain-containing protein [Deltaproteobacteria bacterium]|nr:DUF2905 domain-containing protein [Deltaproteobacteria bacterium]